MVKRLSMNVPIVEIDGDEMTRIIWRMVKDELLLPFVDLRTEYYDLSLPSRDATQDAITLESAEAIKRLGVGVKCATITPNAERVKEYNLKSMYKSPNGTIRAALDGTVFRSPVLVSGIEPSVRTWKKPITVARHAFGDVYRDVESRATGGAKAELVITDATGEHRQTVHTFGESGGIALSMFNTVESITSFAHSCFAYALDVKQDLWFSTKDTISKIYDHTFKDIFEDIFNKQYKQRFEEVGIKYFYTLIDDAVARVIRSEGGFIWALKNYDGDVMSDMVATAFGSLAMMTSVLVSPDGKYEFEAAHGTVTQHFRKHERGEQTSTNSVATIFAWTGAIAKRAELDGNCELLNFAHAVESATLKTIESGIMTKDLAPLCDKKDITIADTLGFIKAVRNTLELTLEANK